MILGTFVCRICGERLPRKRTGVRPSNGAVLYQDDQGRSWKGSMCPSCWKEETSRPTMPKFVPYRKCTFCKKLIHEPTRYFSHASCGPKDKSALDTYEVHAYYE